MYVYWLGFVIAGIGAREITLYYLLASQVLGVGFG